MTGVLVPAGTEQEWLEARRRGITASEIAVVMGLSPWSSPYALYHRKTGALPEQDDNDAMEFGRFAEPYIVAKFGDRHPEFFCEGDGRTLYAHPDRPWQMATPDRTLTERAAQATWAEFIGAEPVAVLECKSDASPGDEWGDDGSDEIPVHYRCQVLWQCDVLGVGTGYVACLFLHSRQLRVYEIVADDTCARADLKLMREEARDFLDSIDLGTPPPVDWRPATGQALKRLHPSVEDKEAIVGVRTAISYRAACRRYKEAERRKNEMTNRLRAEMGSAARAVTWRGEPVATRQVYDVKEHVRKASTTDKLTPARTPKEKT